MRTTLDLPVSLIRRLRFRAAVEGKTLKRLIRDAIERRLCAPVDPGKRTGGNSAVPSLKLGHQLQAKQFSNAALFELTGG